MAELHDALKVLSPTDWDDVPKDSLDSFMSNIFTQSELICNSIPPPANGTPFQESKPHFTKPNEARGWKEMYASPARSHPAHQEHEDLQKNWGKPMKYSQKDNPLNLSLHKMAGKDRHGAWFARRSVHEGMGFSKFRTAMMREFQESLAVQGGPGEGNVRGIGGDQRLEKKEIEGVGTMEVYQLSAQFPGPTTPREFITLLLTTDHGMSEKSAAESKSGQSHVPRSFMIVSKPTSHPDAPERQGYIRGHYESVELIREIPISTAKARSTSDVLSSKANGQTKGEQRDLPQREVDAAELNPVEWTMITRSEPGGGIPRFMVERGTPSAMISDLHKWLDWATNLDESKGPEDVQARAPTEGEKAAALGDEAPVPNGIPTQKSVAAETPRTTTTGPTPAQQPEGGVMSHLTQALGAGIDSYAPTMVSSYLHGSEDSTTAAQVTAPDDDSSDTSSVSSDDSFRSAEDDHRLPTTTRAANPEHPSSAAASSENLSLTSIPSPETLKGTKNLNHHDKEVLKLAKQRDKLDRKLAQKREQEGERLRKTKEAETGEQTKAKERYDKEVQKSEEKHRKEMERLEQKNEKEARKAEEKRRKREDRDTLGRVSRERDEFRSQAELSKREVEILHEQLSDLQRENTAMAVRLGKLGGQDALRGVREEVGRHGRTGSMDSLRSSGGVASDSNKSLPVAVEGDRA